MATTALTVCEHLFRLHKELNRMQSVPELKKNTADMRAAFNKMAIKFNKGGLKRKALNKITADCKAMENELEPFLTKFLKVEIQRFVKMVTPDCKKTA